MCYLLLRVLFSQPVQSEQRRVGQKFFEFFGRFWKLFLGALVGGRPAGLGLQCCLFPRAPTCSFVSFYNHSLLTQHLQWDSSFPSFFEKFMAGELYAMKISSCASFIPPLYFQNVAFLLGMQIASPSHRYRIACTYYYSVDCIQKKITEAKIRFVFPGDLKEMKTQV